MLLNFCQSWEKRVHMFKTFGSVGFEQVIIHWWIDLTTINARFVTTNLSNTSLHRIFFILL